MCAELLPREVVAPPAVTAPAPAPVPAPTAAPIVVGAAPAAAAAAVAVAIGKARACALSSIGGGCTDIAWCGTAASMAANVWSPSHELCEAAAPPGWAVAVVVARGSSNEPIKDVLVAASYRRDSPCSVSSPNSWLTLGGCMVSGCALAGAAAVPVKVATAARGWLCTRPKAVRAPADPAATWAAVCWVDAMVIAGVEGVCISSSSASHCRQGSP